MFGKMGHHDGRDEAGGRAEEVGRAVQRAGEVGCQILRVLQIGQRGGSVEAQRQCDDGNMHVGIFTDKAQ